MNDGENSNLLFLDDYKLEKEINKEKEKNLIEIKNKKDEILTNIPKNEINLLNTEKKILKENNNSSKSILIHDSKNNLFAEFKNNDFNRCDLIKKLFSFVIQKEILIPVFFMIIITATPAYDDPLFYFLTNELKFSGNIMGQISFVSSIATILAVVFYKVFLKNVKFKIIIIFGSILYFFFSNSAFILVSKINISLGISNYVMCLFSNASVAMIGELISMPLLSLACLKSPKFLEGTVYAFFMSALNFGNILSNLCGSVLVHNLKITSNNFRFLPLLINICSILGLLPILLFFCFDEKYFEKQNCSEKNIEIEKSYNNNLHDSECLKLDTNNQAKGEEN